MNFANMKLLAASGLLLLASLACTLSLAEDVQPPPGAEFSGQTPAVSAVEYPPGALDLTRGAENFTQSCAPCHGATGLGDGPQAGELPFEVPPIGTIEFGAEPSLDTWFLQVTDGNLDKFMPPFGQAYSVQERWEILAYVVSLWSRGADWTVQFGDLALPAGFGELESVAPLTGQELLALAESSGALTNVELGEEERAELIGYSKSLALAIAKAEDVVAEDEAAEDELSAEDTDASANEPEEVGGLSGRVINGSDGPLPEGLEVVMIAANALDTSEVARTGIDAQGAFAITDFEIEEGLLYFFTVDVQGLSFFSSVYSPEQIEAGEAVEIEFYESARDTVEVQADVVNLVFNFAAEGRVQVIQQVILSNFGDKAAAPGPEGSPLIYYELPVGASNLLFESGDAGDRYFFEENGFGDIRAVIPGSATYQVLFAYDLPYEKGLEIELPLQFPTVNLGIFVPQDQVRPEGEGFAFHGQQLVQTQSYDSYLYRGEMDAGSRIPIQLKGLHPLNDSAWLRLVNNDDFLLGLLALVASVGGGWWWYRSMEGGGAARPKLSKIQLLDAIVELDDRFEKGEVSERSYTRQRRKLKAELRQLVHSKRGKAK